MPKTNQELESELAAALQSLPRFANELPEPLRPLLELAPTEGSSVVVFLDGLDDMPADVATAIGRGARRNRNIHIQISWNRLPETSVRTGAKQTLEPISILGEPLSHTVLRERR